MTGDIAPTPPWKYNSHGVPISFDTMLPTADDWYPNFPSDLVHVSVDALNNLGEECSLTSPASIRISIWGCDDMGMELYREIWTLQGAVDFVLRIPLPITREELEKLGFDFC